MHCVPTTHLHPFSIPCWSDPRSTHCCWVYGHILLQVVWNPSNDHFCPWCHWYWSRMKGYETSNTFQILKHQVHAHHLKLDIWNHLWSLQIQTAARWCFHKNNTFCDKSRIYFDPGLAHDLVARLSTLHTFLPGQNKPTLACSSIYLCTDIDIDSLHTSFWSYLQMYMNIYLYMWTRT